jgi:FkbM family methyltransferase
MKHTILVICFIVLLFILFKNRVEYFKDTNLTLDKIHKILKIKFGSFKKELPEQQMIYKHIKPTSKILELGPNIGRSSLIANYILKDKTQHLCIETIKETCSKLKENRDLNNMKFHIFEGAISNKPLYQKGWRCTDKYNKDYTKVTTKKLKDIIDIYKIDFNTIIADCEGCLVPVLRANEWFLDKINLIILEHDFDNNDDLKWFKNKMKDKNFRITDKLLKGTPNCPSINWKEGLKNDKIFVSVWEKY